MSFEAFGKTLQSAVTALGEGAETLLSGYAHPEGGDYRPRALPRRRVSLVSDAEIESLARAISENHDPLAMATLGALGEGSPELLHLTATLARTGRAPGPGPDVQLLRGSEEGEETDVDLRRAALVARGTRLFADGAPTPENIALDAVHNAAAWEEDLNVTRVPDMPQDEFDRRIARARGLPVWESIERDVHRTLPRHADFAHAESRGRRGLQRMLAVYATLDAQVGYVQGMNFVAAIILATVGCEERRALRLFRAAMSDPRLRLRRLYLPGLPGLHTALERIERYTEEQVPDLAAHLRALGVVPMLYACEWVLTLFAYVFPPHVASRVLTLVFMDGWDAVGGVAVAFMLRYKRALLAETDLEGFLTVIKSVHHERDCNEAFDGSRDPWLILEADIVEAAVEIYRPSFDFEVIR